MLSYRSKKNREKSKKPKKILKKISLGILFLTIFGTIGTGGYVTYRIVKNLNEVKAINKLELVQKPNSEIYASDGTTLVWTDATYQHISLKLSDTPDILIKLLKSTEDKTFDTNDGYSREGMINMILSTAKYETLSRLSKIPGLSFLGKNLEPPRGGSTATQQLIKNIRYLDSDINTVDRKIQETALSIRLTKDYTKDEILEAYLNKVGFLESSYGFNTAYYLLYGETIHKDLTDNHAIARYATIVGMLKNPTLYNPRTNPVDSKNRRDTVLYNAVIDGHLTEDQFNEISQIDIADGLKDQGWFTDQVYKVSSANGSYVNSIIEQLSEKGYDLKNTEYPITVVSNLNIEQNTWLQTEVSKPEYYVNERQQAAVTVVEPQTGKVLAQVGSRHGASATDLNRAIQQTRSSGSTVKPFLDYAPLIEFAGYDMNAIFNADTTVYAGTNVTVRNYANVMYGNVTMDYALKMSMNVPAVTALELQEPWMNQTIMDNIGLKNHKYNQDWELLETNNYGGSDALGINDSTKNFAGAFAALSNYGKYIEPMYIDTVTQGGETIKIEPTVRQSMSPRTAYKLLMTLNGVPTPTGSARSAAIPEYAGYAVKTGTVGMDDNQPIYYDTEHKNYAGIAAHVAGPMIATDSWMSGTTKSVAISVWTGFDDPSVYGDWINEETQTRTNIFTSAMKYFNANKDTSQWAPTEEIVELNKTKETNIIEIPNSNTFKQFISKTSKVQDVEKNPIEPTQEQIDFYNKFQENKLDQPYKDIKNYYINNNIKGYSLKELGLSETTGIYDISTSGGLINE